MGPAHARSHGAGHRDSHRVQIGGRRAGGDRLGLPPWPPVADGVSGPRVTRVVLAVDTGLAINRRGLEAQMQGGIMDGIAQVLTSSLHVEAGLPLEGSWDQYFYTRQWNVPLDIEVIVMPSTSDRPGGAGELGVPIAMAAVACAYTRATGRVPSTFPINHHTLGFEPLPRSVIPVEPIDGLEHAF